MATLDLEDVRSYRAEISSRSLAVRVLYGGCVCKLCQFELLLNLESICLSLFSQYIDLRFGIYIRH